MCHSQSPVCGWTVNVVCVSARNAIDFVLFMPLQWKPWITRVKDDAGIRQQATVSRGLVPFVALVLSQLPTRKI
jgi:hypothetical protein